MSVRLYGSAGPIRTYSPDFHIWMLCFKKFFTNIRVEMEEWEDWLSDDSPPWVAYRAVMSGRLVALYK